MLLIKICNQSLTQLSNNRRETALREHERPRHKRSKSNNREIELLVGAINLKRLFLVRFSY